MVGSWEVVIATLHTDLVHNLLVPLMSYVSIKPSSSMNTDVEGRSTAAFDILVSDDAKTGYTTVISGTLDADTDLVQHHNIFRAGVEQPLSFRYSKFRVQHIRGEVGAGLRYIAQA